MQKRNSLLELFRFLFCMSVLGIHLFTEAKLNYFRAGYLGVEFFFILSGYFVGAYYGKYQKGWNIAKRLKTVADYALSRLKRLYPLYFLALIVMLFVRIVIKENTIYETIHVIKKCYAEFFLLQWTPLGNEVLISSGWFVPAVFFGGILFVLLLALFQKPAGFFAAPIISFLIYRYYFLLIGKIDVISSYYGVLRGVAGIGLGVFVYFLCNELPKELPQAAKQKFGNRFLKMFSCLLYLVIFCYTGYGRRSKADFIIIFLYALGLFTLIKANHKVSDKHESLFLALGKITYPLYLFHMPVIRLVFGLFNIF